MNDLTVNLLPPPETIAYVVDGVKAWFGIDHATKDERMRLEQLIRIAMVESSTIQCVGMSSPVPIGDVYVELSLVKENAAVSVSDILRSKQNAIISAGPGNGKTTFLRWTFVAFSESKEYVPLLITLRRPDAANELAHIIERLKDGTVAKAVRKLRDRQIILLVDGYDEISTKQRKEVSELLLNFEALNVGTYILSSRTSYEIYELKAAHFTLAPFGRQSAALYVSKLAAYRGLAINAEDLLNELDKKNFTSFWQHPLLLTLVLILKSGPSTTIPSNSIGLLRRALEVLSFQWDHDKGISRESVCDIDAPDREQCMMHIAYEMRLPIEGDDKVVALGAQFLKLLNRTDVLSRQLLQEIARFYGLLVPTEEGNWTFSHRTIHDYLAAKYWVENGRFDPRRVLEWNSRAAYAACLQMDATETIERSLVHSEDLNVLTECLSNTRRYDRERVAKACLAHFSEFPILFKVIETATSAEVATTQADWITNVDDSLLESLLSISMGVKRASYTFILCLTLAEYRRRNMKIGGPLCHRLYQRFQRASFKICVASTLGDYEDMRFSLFEIAHPTGTTDQGEKR